MKLTKNLKAGIKAARKAGNILKKSFQDNNEVSYKEHEEPVTQIDLACSRAISDILKKESEINTVVSEEVMESHKKLKTNTAWIIDPLDGTTNFTRHLPLFTVSIALVKDNRSTLGIIYDPIHDDMFVAQNQKGAWRNDRPINTSQKTLNGNGLLLTGRWHREKDRIRHQHLMKSVEGSALHIRRLGSAALMLAYVACGQAEGVLLTGIKPWDVMAGALIVKEAGGVVTDYQGKDWKIEDENMFAANPKTHKKISGLI